MLYPNHKIEDIFKLVHKTQDPKDIQWVIDNLSEFNYSSNYYKDEDEFNYYHYDCGYYNLITFIIAKTVATEEQKDYLRLLYKAESFVFHYKNGALRRFPTNLYLVRCMQFSKRNILDLKNPFEDPQ